MGQVEVRSIPLLAACEDPPPEELLLSQADYKEAYQLGVVHAAQAMCVLLEMMLEGSVDESVLVLFDKQLGMPDKVQPWNDQPLLIQSIVTLLEDNKQTLSQGKLIANKTSDLPKIMCAEDREDAAELQRAWQSQYKNGSKAAMVVIADSRLAGENTDVDRLQKANIAVGNLLDKKPTIQDNEPADAATVSSIMMMIQRKDLETLGCEVIKEKFGGQVKMKKATHDEAVIILAGTVTTSMVSGCRENMSMGSIMMMSGAKGAFRQSFRQAQQQPRGPVVMPE